MLACLAEGNLAAVNANGDLAGEDQVDVVVEAAMLDADIARSDRINLLKYCHSIQLSSDGGIVLHDLLASDRLYAATFAVTTLEPGAIPKRGDPRWSVG